MGIYQPRQRAGVNIWVEKLPCQPTSIRAVLTSTGEICILSEDASSIDKKMHERMAPNEPHRFIKINLNINYLKLKKTLHT